VTIKGIEGLAPEQVRREVEQGAKFVLFSYCVSALVITFRRSSPIYFVRAGENAVVTGLPWTLLTLVAGWWGFPWGLIWTPMAVFTNLRGGRDVTAHFAGYLASAHAPQDPTVWPPPPDFTIPSTPENGGRL